MRKNGDRLKVLQSLAVLHTGLEVVFDDLTRTAAQTFGVSIARVSLLDAGRDWFKSCVGFPVSQSPASTSFCKVFLTSDDEVVVVEDTLLDARFGDRCAKHPFLRSGALVGRLANRRHAVCL